MFKSCNFTMNILKRTKGQSESAYQRTNNTMAKRKKNKRKNNDLQNLSSERLSKASHTKDRSARRCSRRVCDTYRVNLVTNPLVIVTQILHNGQPSHGGDRNIFEVMTSPLPKWTLVSVVSVLAASSIKEILIGATSSRISYHLRDIYSISMCCWNICTDDVILSTTTIILMNKVISHIHYLYIASSLLKKRIGYKLFTITLYFNSSQYYTTLDKTLAMTLLWSVNTTNGWNVHQNASKITIRQVIFFNCELFIWSLSNI
jgi:hypothetical protein